MTHGQTRLIRMALVAIVAALSMVSCGEKSDTVNPAAFARGWKKYDGVNFTLYAPANSPRPRRGLEATVKACDDIYDLVARELKITTDHDIKIYMFTSSEDCEAATGKPANFVDGFTICTKLGAPLGGLVAEAVCNSIDPEAKSFPLIRDGVRNLFDLRDVNVQLEAAARRDKSSWPTLENMLYKQSCDDKDVYQYASASFVAFLIARYGTDQFKMLWRSVLDLRPSIEKIYGGTIPQMEEEWFRMQDRLAKRT